jgi:hypothetical protein
VGVEAWRGDALEGGGGGGLARARSKPKFYTSPVSKSHVDRQGKGYCLWIAFVGGGGGRGDALEGGGGGGLARVRSKPKFYTSPVSGRNMHCV